MPKGRSIKRENGHGAVPWEERHSGKKKSFRGKNGFYGKGVSRERLSEKEVSNDGFSAYIGHAP